MKATKNKVIYTDEPADAGWSFDPKVKPLSEDEIAALGIGIPSLSQRKKQAKENRINLRLSSTTLNGLKQRAEEAGMPYQTLAVSVLHMIATGKLKLSLIQNGK